MNEQTAFLDFFEEALIANVKCTYMEFSVCRRFERNE